MQQKILAPTAVVALALALALIAGVVLAQLDVRKERVEFASGASSATIKGNISGDEMVDYLLGAKAGQHMKVTLTTDNGSNYFNLMEPDEDYVAFSNSSMSADGTVWEGELPKTGDTKIRVYLMRNAARRGESASYTLEVGIE